MKIYTLKEGDISEQIADFLKTHPLLSLNALEKELSIPQGSLSRAIVNETVIPPKHHWGLIKALASYGFKYDGFSLEVDEVGNIFGYKRGSLVRTKEIKNKDGSISISYVVEESRFLACDYFDL